MYFKCKAKVKAKVKVEDEIVREKVDMSFNILDYCYSSLDAETRLRLQSRFEIDERNKRSSTPHAEHIVVKADIHAVDNSTITCLSNENFYEPVNSAPTQENFYEPVNSAPTQENFYDTVTSDHYSTQEGFYDAVASDHSSTQENFYDIVISDHYSTQENFYEPENSVRYLTPVNTISFMSLSEASVIQDDPITYE
jgi:hypothetical protein